MKQDCLPYGLNPKVPLIFPSGKICRNIMARTDQRYPDGVTLGRGRRGTFGRPPHEALSSSPGLGLLDDGLLAVSRSTFPLELRLLARGIDGFERKKMIAIRKLHVLVKDIFTATVPEANGLTKLSPCYMHVLHSSNIKGM